MKFAIKTTILTALLGVSLSAQALKNDTDQPINIDSGSQSLDMNTNTVVFDDGVTITQGSIIVKANKVTIVRKEGKKETLDAVGSPVTFQQTLDDGKPVNGKGSSVKYDLNSEFLTLTGDAELKQLDSFIKAPLITYDVKKQQLKATSGGKTRVKTVLIPNQLNQNKK
ncbi:MAG: lipopolysaccharide transport periplasmic protein LptA [Haemophilus parahaemolyticus]|nr:lipopolysaccharide transport periplasmic protein LptA [Haemophilus parahaemolyticus]